MSTYLIAFFAMGIAIFIYLIFVSTAKLMKKTEINTRKRLENIFKEKTIIEEEMEEGFIDEFENEDYNGEDKNE